MKLYSRLLPTTALLAFAVIVAGAWVRLSDAGLGCPDWPGCYGQWLGVPAHAADAGKAWKEMFHRYLAGALGLAILGLCVAAWRQRPRPPLLWPCLLLALAGLQAALGMWTVTLLLKPLVVSAHLLGGMAILTLLVKLKLDCRPAAPLPPALRRLGLAALFLLCIQIALGGWVSSNYAGLACSDFPTCRGQWLPDADFAAAFGLWRPLGLGTDGLALSAAALRAIHWSHRAGALAAALALAAFALALRRHSGPTARQGSLLLALLAVQLGLGVANVALGLPLPLAVAHNAAAALLLVATFAAWHGPARPATLVSLPPGEPGRASRLRSPPSPQASP